MIVNRLKFPGLALALVLTGVGCADASNDLLLRLQFAGTTALLGNTNAAYLTNFSARPESLALSTQIVAKTATLPAKWLGSTETNHNAIIRPVFAEWLARGFTLELHGDKNGVTDFAVAAKADADTAKRWASAWDSAANQWSANGRIAMKHSGDWFVVAGAKNKEAVSAALAAMQKSITQQTLDAGAILKGELTSTLVPGPVQRSVYGNFDRLKLTVTPADQTLRVKGTATYAKDLPKLGPSAEVPHDLVTDNAISFTMVHNPSAWLETDSPLRQFLPNPIPSVAFFWGTEVSPYQLFMAIPFGGKELFNNSFGPALRDKLKPVAKAIDSGEVVLDTNKTSVVMRTVPFVAPKVTLKESGTNNYLVAEFFPPSDTQVIGLTPALVERVSNRTNLVLYDWEYTKVRFDSWHALGQLALFVANKEQLSGEANTLKWLRAIQPEMPNGGNISTEITQAGPRELSLNRRGILPFTSTELFWLANWLESSNFPSANFLMPATPQ